MKLMFGDESYDQTLHCLQKHFTQDEGIIKSMYDAWEANAKDRYRSLMHKIRHDIDKFVHLTEETQQKWTAAWINPVYKKRCKQYSKNPRSETGGPGSGVTHHTGGSLSYTQHKKRMVKIFIIPQLSLLIGSLCHFINY